MGTSGRITTLGLWLSTALVLSACSEIDLPEATLVPPEALTERLPVIKNHIEETAQLAVTNSNQIEVVSNYCMVLSAYSFSEQANACYGYAQELDPKEFRWRYHFAVTLADLGQTQEAITAFRRALKIDPNYYWASLRLGDLLTEDQDFGEAARVYEKVLGHQPELPEVHYGLGRVAAGNNDLNGAISYFESAVSLAPEIGKYHYVLAQALQQRGETENAAREFGLYETFRQNAFVRNDELILEAANLNRGDGPHVARGEFYLSNHNLEQAVKEFENALKVNPNVLDVRRDLLEVYGQLGMMEAAEQLYGESSNGREADPLLHVNWAVIQKQRANFDESVEAYEKAMSLDPSLEDASVEYGVVLNLSGQSEKAKELFAKIAAQYPTNGEAQYRYGDALLRTGKTNEAMEHLEASLDTVDERRLPYVYQKLGQAYYELGQTNKAQHAYDRGMKLAREVGSFTLANEIEKEKVRIAVRKP